MYYLQENWQVFLIGCLGGIGSEALHWRIIFREMPAKAAPYARHPGYWVMTLILILLGGVLSALLLAIPAPTLAALQIGLSAPLTLQRLASLKDDQARDNQSIMGRITEFLAV